MWSNVNWLKPCAYRENQINRPFVLVYISVVYATSSSHNVGHLFQQNSVVSFNRGQSLFFKLKVKETYFLAVSRSTVVN